MSPAYSNRFKKSYKLAPLKVQGDFDKQLLFLLKNIRHPSLQAKKYDETRNVWQARVNRNWRFYFLIDGNIYHFIDIMKHPK